MYARVVTVPLQPTTTPEIARAIWRDTILPRFKEQPGFRGLVTLRHRGEDRGMSITFWDSEEDFQAMMASGASQEVMAKTEHFRAGPPLSQDDYDVVLHEDV
jgi:heme-degrading monooxygenase HmoA